MAGLRIQEQQDALGINDAELARRMETNQTQLGRLKNGDRGMTHDWMRRFARALDCSVADLLPDADFPNRPSPADMRLLTKMREADTDADDLLDLLTGVNRLVERQVKRRATKEHLNGDHHQNSQLVDIWDSLSPKQKGHMLDMMKAAASMNNGHAEAA